jgi:ParB/RepB/Spo0J family partition protein
MQTTTVRISDLQTHPLQQPTYGDLAAHEFAALKADIARRGVRSPIHVTRAGMIIDGHQRVRACRELGIEEISAIICEEEGQPEIDESFVLANLVRRQLDPVAKAKAVQMLVDIERRRINDEDSQEPGDLRDRIAKHLGGNISGRTVDRLLQLARLPAPIHQAVSAGHLPMTKALRLHQCSSGQLEIVANRISAGESPRTVVDSVLPRKKADRQEAEETPAVAYAMLVDFLAEKLSCFEAQPESLVGTAGDHEATANVLDRSARFLHVMRDHEQAARQQALLDIQELLS